MSNYFLYGVKMIEDDSTLEKFAQCIINGVPEDDLEEIKQRYNVEDNDREYEEEYMQRVRDILYDDISRTDIDYSELMERFAPELGNLLYDMENHGEYEEEYMQRVRDILYDDISRTDIDYSELMERFAPELGNLLYDMENHGYDLSALRLTFFGEKVGECFNKLVEEKIWFMKFYS